MEVLKNQFLHNHLNSNLLNMKHHMLKSYGLKYFLDYVISVY